MIKFRCLNCGQKLAVSDDGVNAVISCTNCKECIVVPPYSISEFFAAEPIRHPAPPTNGTLELIRPHRAPVEGVPAAMRAALIPQLARMMMNRLVQALFAQRESLIDTQAEATRRMGELEGRIARAQTNVERKIARKSHRGPGKPVGRERRGKPRTDAGKFPTRQESARSRERTATRPPELTRGWVFAARVTPARSTATPRRSVPGD